MRILPDLEGRSRVYLIGLSSGHVKVGVTKCLQDRMAVHRAHYGSLMSWVHIFPPMREAREIEREVLKRFRAAGRVERSPATAWGAVEEFAGLTRESAMVEARAAINGWLALRQMESDRLRDRFAMFMAQLSARAAA